MTHRRFVAGVIASAALGFAAGYLPARLAHADGKAAAAAPGAAAGKCKLHGKACCDPAISAHLAKDAVFSACGESESTFLGEDGSKDTCKYFFKVQGEKEDETYVQVYAVAQKDVLPAPNDPFFSYKKAGKAYIADKAKSPKSAPMLAAQTGIYFPGKGYAVTVNASTKVCTKPEATKLARSIK